MAITREEIQKLASLGRGGDTMLAHINPQEAKMLKDAGGSGTINPNTGLPEFLVIRSVYDPRATSGYYTKEEAQKRASAPGPKPIGWTEQIVSIDEILEEQKKAAEKNRKYNLATSLALSFVVPGLGGSVATTLGVSNAVGTALVSTSAQMAQGVDFDTALRNATVNAIIETGAPSVATEINKLISTTGLPEAISIATSDAITSAGASAAKTIASGGSDEDIKRNVIGAIAGSSTSSLIAYKTDDISAGRLAGATVGGAVTGGTEGAFTGLAGEYAGQKTAEQARLTDARSKMIASADGSTLSDSGTLGNVVVTGSRETPGITDTSIITPTGRISDREVMGAMRPRPISGTLSEVTVTAPRETPDITETSIVSPDSLPEVEVKGEREEEPQAQPEEESPVDEQGRYRPNLFIYGGVKPSTLPQTLGTSVEKVPSASTTTGTSVGLGGRGEIESKESGKKRKTVWNEESLRLKDALGL